jgi:recombinational DNA repair ATPase RecF
VGEVGPNGVGETDLLEAVGHPATLGAHSGAAVASPTWTASSVPTAAPAGR